MSNANQPIGPDLRNALIAMVKKRVPDSEVEDIVQQTMVDAFASPHAPEDAESFRRWIFGVAKNKVVDYHRRAGRETFDVPEVVGMAAPHQEADMLRWAEKHLPPGEENKATLEWMLREGDGEKLESIAETEQLPAPRVRQRVSRLRRHLKQHWQKEVAVLAALGVLMTGLFLFLRRPNPTNPIANEDVARAEEIRKHAFENCLAADWNNCVQKLDDAKKLDPAGDTQPAVQKARDNAAKAQKRDQKRDQERDKGVPPTAPTASVIDSNNTPPPVETLRKDDLQLTPSPTTYSSSMPSPKSISTESFGSDVSPMKAPPRKKSDGKTSPTPTPAPMKPSAPNTGKTSAKPQGKAITDSITDLGSNNIGKTGFKVSREPSKELDTSPKK